MELLIVLVSGFVLAAFTPWLHKLLGDGLGYVVALLPLGIAAYFGRFVGTLGPDEAVVVQYRWVPGVDLSLSLYLDGLSLLFALLITGIGALVFLYAGGYLAGNRQLGVFYSYMLVFMAAMLGVVLAGNLLTLYVFWELTTLSSFLLVGFEHQREAARTAAVQALLVTALGGLAMLAGLVLLGMAGGTFELAALLKEGAAVREHGFYPAILALILLGAFTKSAQFPFQFWLPNAMQAPTPVSAYLHSATMVKAGVYLLARMLPVLGDTPAWEITVTTFGAITMVLGAYLAFFEHDLKGILAYLTINVLGTLVMLVGVGTPLAVKAALTYLLAHALYKGALFLMAGAVDHAAHTRDIRELGGLWRKMPVTAVVAVVAALSMAGIAPLFGFIAKELFFEAAWEAPTAALLLTAASVLASIFLVAGAGLVSLRPFFGAMTSHSAKAHETGFSMWIGPLILVAASLALGLYSQKLATPLIEPAVSAALSLHVPVELALWHGVTVPLVLSITVLILGLGLYFGRSSMSSRLPGTSLYSRWGPVVWYEASLAVMNDTARWQTKYLQSGYLRIYVFVVISVAVVLVGVMFASAGMPELSQERIGIRLYEAVAAFLIVAAAFVAVRSDSRFRAVAAMGVVGFNVAWIFDQFGAPDLAMTQIVVESLTVLLFVLAFLHLPRFTLASSRRTRIRDAVLASLAGVGTTLMLLLVTSLQLPLPISDFYARTSYLQAHGRNVVNVILVDFRALDTLGEITVLSAAAIGVYTLVKLVVVKGRAG